MVAMSPSSPPRMGIMAGRSTRYACIIPWLADIAMMVLSSVFMGFTS